MNGYLIHISLGISGLQSQFLDIFLCTVLCLGEGKQEEVSAHDPTSGILAFSTILTLVVEKARVVPICRRKKLSSVEETGQWGQLRVLFTTVLKP